MWAANMSLGINILLALVEKTASMLDPAYDIEVLEMHHRHKIDAPSGTALALGRAAAAGRQVKLEDVWRKSRDGHTGARPAGEIGFATLRGGEEVGVHTVMFAAAGERLELSHRAFSRETYASGAVRAALWLQGKTPGLYGMKDVLGLLDPIPVVLVARRAHRGERGLELLGDPAALGRAPGSGRPPRGCRARSAPAARSPQLDAQPVGVEPVLLALAVGRHAIDDQLAVGQQQGLAAPGVEVVALEQPPQQRDVEAAEAQHRPGAQQVHRQADQQVGQRCTPRISHLKPSGDRLRWGRSEVAKWTWYGVSAML